MVLGIIKNKDDSYDYLFESNKKLAFLYVGKYGFLPSNKTYIYNLFSYIFNRKDYTYLKNNSNYQIYFDYNTGLYHFIKDNQEDYDMFFKNNGTGAIMYIDSKKNRSNVKKFVISGLGISLILSVGIVGYLNFFTKIENYNQIENVSIVSRNIDYEYALELINNSNLDDDLKKYLGNEKLMNDIFSYYSDSAMKYKTGLCLENLEVVYYNSNDSNSMGFYDPDDSNKIYISTIYKDSDKYKRIVAHEYIHILEDQHCQYAYLLETMDELALKEYFGEKIISYQNGVKNNMLLIDIIGSEPIMKLVFGGNSDEFEKILKSNLNAEDYNLLVSYLKDDSYCSGHNQENKKIRLILCELYKNIYGKDIKEDSNILYDTFYKDGKINCNDISKSFLNDSRENDLNYHKSVL